jgi:peptidoglycan hydrolase-like protein with peptidoglycan-binding domain
MHFQIDQGPAAIEIDWSTVPGASGAGSPAAASSSSAAPRTSTGTTVTTTIELQEETVLTRGSKGTAVERIQRFLQVWDPGALPEHGVDGGYGSETVEWVKKYQEAMGLQATGIVDGLTAAMLSTEKAGARTAAPQP